MFLLFYSILNRERKQQGDSLHWLLREPILYGTRIDHPSWASATLSRLLQTAGISTLGQVVELVGPQLDNPAELKERLGITSTRTTEKILDHWKQQLTRRNIQLLTDFSEGSISPDPEDPFPAIFLAVDFKDCSGPLLEPGHLVPLEGAPGTALYKLMVKTLNRKKLNERTDTPWRGYLCLAPESSPQWRSLYKPPLCKRHGDLQWRVLHGILAVNSFLSVLNRAIDDKCPFCDERENIFHCFYECHRLSALFLFLQTVFISFKESFNKQVFICGFRYTRQQKHKSQLLSFVLGQVKMAVYITRKRKVEEDLHIEPVPVCTGLIKSRLLIDFNFYRTTGDLDSFKDLWCWQNALCSIEAGEMFYANYLL